MFFGGMYIVYITEKKTNPRKETGFENINNSEINQSILNAVNSELSIQTFNEKNPPANRNQYSFKCDYTIDHDENKIIIQNDSLYEQDIVCLFMKDTPSNHFPVIVFEDLLDELNPLAISDYEIVNEEANAKASTETPAYLAKRENEARGEALKVSNHLLNNLSFDARIALLDKIVFKKKENYDYLYNYQLGEFIVSNHNYISQGLLPENPEVDTNLRIINLFVKPYEKAIEVKNGNLHFISTRNNGMNQSNPLLSSIAFDVYEILYVLTKQYAKFLFSFNSLTPADLIEILNPLFTNNEQKQSFLSFFRYFNSLNAEESQNFLRRKNNPDISVSTKDQLILDNFRRFFSSNIDQLDNQFTNYSTDDNWQNETYRKIKYGLLHYPAYDSAAKIVQDQRSKSLWPEDMFVLAENTLVNPASGKLINKAAYNDFFLYIVNNSYTVYIKDIEQVFNFSQTSSMTNYLKSYFLISSTYVPSSNQSLLVGDVFPLQKIVNANKDFIDNKDLQVTGAGCLAEPINFQTLSGVPFEAKILKNVVKNNLTTSKLSYQNIAYNDLASRLDKEMLNAMAGFFETEELLVNLYAFFAYQYPDQRKVVGSCSYNYEQRISETGDSLLTIASQEKSGLNQFSDYLKFRMFGIKLFGQKIERKILRTLIDYKGSNAKLYEYSAKTYGFFQKEHVYDELKKHVFAYSTNLLSTNAQEQRRWSSVYVPYLIKLDTPWEAFYFQVEHEVKNKASHAIDYDYNNLYIVLSDTSNVASLDDQDNLGKAFLYDDYKNRQKYVGILLLLGNIYGSITPEYELKGISKSIKGTISVIEKIKHVFLDKNMNNKFDSVYEEPFKVIQED